MPKRFNVKTCMLQEDDGKYVLYSDYTLLEQRHTFVIRENFPADAGFRITLVTAKDENEALEMYKKATYRDNLPSWVSVRKHTALVTEVCRYDNSTELRNFIFGDNE